MFVAAGPLLIVGRAKSGEAVANLLKFSNPNLKISFYDDKKELSDFENPRELLKQKWSHVVLSPGYPDKAWFKELQEAGSILTQELDVAASFLEKEKVYAITGSVGKSTCAWIAKELFEKLGKKVFLGGNFGIPLAEYALRKLQNAAEAVEYVVLELSSFQIERMAFMVDRALFLNLLPNHLDRYIDLVAYYESKVRLLQFSREGTWGLDPGGDLHRFMKDRGLEAKVKWIKPEAYDEMFYESRFIGAHNRANLTAVMQFVASPDINEAMVLKELLSIEPLPHRIEFFEHKGMHFINDSKATTVESVLTAYVALRDHFETHKIFWLLGGRDKNLPWHKLKRLWSDRHLSFIFFGECAELAKKETGFEGQTFAKLGEALSYLKTKMFAGELLVLSPAGTSLDEFKNFEDRGQFFKKTVIAEF